MFTCYSGNMVNNNNIINNKFSFSCQERETKVIWIFNICLCTWSVAWQLYMMVAQNMLRTYDRSFPRKINRIWRLFRCKQNPSTNRNTWFTQCVRTVFWATNASTMVCFDITHSLIECNRSNIPRRWTQCWKGEKIK